jgi:imidazolonepropionase-like amidohydrolase
LVNYGMTSAQAIQTATTVASEMMGWQDRIGSTEKGKFADVLAVSGDPLKDITGRAGNPKRYEIKACAHRFYWVQFLVASPEVDPCWKSV